MNDIRLSKSALECSEKCQIYIFCVKLFCEAYTEGVFVPGTRRFQMIFIAMAVNWHIFTTHLHGNFDANRTREILVRILHCWNQYFQHSFFKWIVHKLVLFFLHSQRIFYEILLNRTEIRLYLPFPDWFGTKRTSVWFKINLKMVNTI